MWVVGGKRAEIGGDELWVCARVCVSAWQRCVREVWVGRAGWHSTVVEVAAVVIVKKWGGGGRREEVRRARACRERIRGWWIVPSGMGSGGGGGCLGGGDGVYEVVV